MQNCILPIIVSIIAATRKCRHLYYLQVYHLHVLPRGRGRALSGGQVVSQIGFTDSNRQSIKVIENVTHKTSVHRD